MLFRSAGLFLVSVLLCYLSKWDSPTWRAWIVKGLTTGFLCGLLFVTYQFTVFVIPAVACIAAVDLYQRYSGATARAVAVRLFVGSVLGGVILVIVDKLVGIAVGADWSDVISFSLATVAPFQDALPTVDLLDFLRTQAYSAVSFGLPALAMATVLLSHSRMYPRTVFPLGLGLITLTAIYFSDPILKSKSLSTYQTAAYLAYFAMLGVVTVLGGIVCKLTCNAPRAPRWIILSATLAASIALQHLPDFDFGTPVLSRWRAVFVLIFALVGLQFIMRLFPPRFGMPIPLLLAGLFGMMLAGIVVHVWAPVPIGHQIGRAHV